jgi:hypothetical protein
MSNTSQKRFCNVFYFSYSAFASNSGSDTKIKVALAKLMLCGTSSSVIAEEYDFNPTNYENLTWTVNAKNSYDSMYWGDYFSSSKAINGSLPLKYTQANDNWTDFFQRKVIEKVSGREYLSIGSESCQCVALVKELTGETGGTSTWRKGVNLSYDSTPSWTDLPEPGTIIATFGNVSSGITTYVYDEHGNYIYNSNGQRKK